MEINVSQLLKSHIGATRDYGLDEPADVTGSGRSSPVRGSIKLTRTNRGILVQGSLNTSVPSECGRCLKKFDYPLSFDLEEEFFPVIDVNSGMAVEIPDEPGSFMIDEHHILNLDEAIRQNALLAIPMKPLCKEKCKGICQTCGKDLNRGKCGCNTQEIDPRWAKLLELAAVKNKNIRRKKKTE
jgi:uncharacterized protein